jgi:hypothetical protein
VSQPSVECSLSQEWQKTPKNWFAIYQWKPTARVGYSEQIAEWIIASRDDISLSTRDLREVFRIENHRGQIKLNTRIAPFHGNQCARYTP